jgi:GNAT superfamily N-acetyltransferase
MSLKSNIIDHDSYEFRQAQSHEVPSIWEILQQAIRRRKADGSKQWQDGYPNPEAIESDIAKGAGFVLVDGSTIAGYCALFINDEPAYKDIEGQWLTTGDFVVFHRLAVAETHVGKGLAKKIFECIEQFARNNNIGSIKADTNFDNPAMLHTFTKMGYTYCGEVYFRGSARKAYEKVLP